MKKILILGASSAIAMEVAKIYAAKKSEIFLVARDAQKLESIKKDLLARGASSVISFIADLKDVGSHQILIDKAISELDGIDVVLLAYGILGNQELAEKDFNAANEIINVNFNSSLSLLLLLANYFEEKRSGTLAVISSVAGDRGRKSNYIYGASKAALSTVLAGLRNRLAGKADVLTIKPGFVDTPMTAALKKGLLFASPEKVASDIVNAIDARKNELYTPWFWRWIMLIIKLIPEFIFKRMSI